MSMTLDPASEDDAADAPRQPADNDGVGLTLEIVDEEDLSVTFEVVGALPGDSPPATPAPESPAADAAPAPPVAATPAPSALTEGAPQAPAFATAHAAPQSSLPALDGAPAIPALLFPVPAPMRQPAESAPAAIASALATIIAAHLSSSDSAPASPAPRPCAPTTAPIVRKPVARRPTSARRRSMPVDWHAWRAPQRRSRLSTMFLGALLAIELPVALVLALYAGVIPLLPSTPPPAQALVSGAGASVQARQSLYCWFTPGEGHCAAPNGLAPRQLPELTIHQESILQFTFGYPAPTLCSASVPDTTSTVGAMKPLGPLLARTDAGSGSLMARTYGLRITLAPGVYRLDVTCRWLPAQMLRWLQGQGESSYWIELRVLPR
jgi:hypothetical protein